MNDLDRAIAAETAKIKRSTTTKLRNLAMLLLMDLDSPYFRYAWRECVDWCSDEEMPTITAALALRFLGEGWTFEDAGEIARGEDGRALDFAGEDYVILRSAGWTR